MAAIRPGARSSVKVMQAAEEHLSLNQYVIKKLAAD
jgi:predicted HicB family RNase H-like nuclease